MALDPAARPVTDLYRASRDGEAAANPLRSAFAELLHDMLDEPTRMRADARTLAVRLQQMSDLLAYDLVLRPGGADPRRLGVAIKRLDQLAREIETTVVDAGPRGCAPMLATAAEAVDLLRWADAAPDAVWTDFEQAA